MRVTVHSGIAMVLRLVAPIGNWEDGRMGRLRLLNAGP